MLARLVLEPTKKAVVHTVTGEVIDSVGVEEEDTKQLTKPPVFLEGNNPF